MSTHDVRKAIVFSCVLLLATSALPAIAAKPGPQKLYSLEFVLPAKKSYDSAIPNPSYYPLDDPDEALRGQLQLPVEVAVDIKNESPPSVGASNIASMQFTVSGNMIVKPGNYPYGCYVTRGDCTVDFDTNTVSVTNISPPVQAAEVFRVVLEVNTCVNAGDASVLGDTPTATNIKVSTGSQIDNGSFFSPYFKDTSFPYLLTFSAESLDPTKRTPTGVSCGKIGCEKTFEVQNSYCTDVPTSPDCVVTVRGNNTNGVCAATQTVDYYITNNLSIAVVPFKLNFKWESDSFAAFAYKVNVPWPSGGDPPSLQLSWLPQNGPPVFIPAPLCNDPLEVLGPGALPLPIPYGTLASNVNRNVQKIKVTLDQGLTEADLPPVPFPVVIDSERMLVTSIGSNDWSVTRGDGLTTATSHAAGAFVMYTGLPTLSEDFQPTPEQSAAGYQAGMKAKMCLAPPFLQDNGDDTWSGWAVDSGDGKMAW